MTFVITLVEMIKNLAKLHVENGDQVEGIQNGYRDVKSSMVQVWMLKVFIVEIYDANINVKKARVNLKMQRKKTRGKKNKVT